MKFLMFNAVVSAALVYLMIGDEYRSAAVEDVVDRARDTVVTAVEDAERMLVTDGDAEDTTPSIIGEPEPEVLLQAPEPVAFTPRQVEPVVTEESDFQVGVVTSPGVVERESLDELSLEWDPGSVFPGWQAKQSLPEIDDPSVVQRRNEVLGREPVGGDVTAAVTPAFMTAQERQQELHALAEEMEIMFATELAR